jgi:hypothetical protein
MQSVDWAWRVEQKKKKRAKCEWMCLSRDPNFDRSPPTGYIDVMGEKAKNPGAIKTLGAYIGSDDNCRAALEKKLADQETFFRRLKLAPPDVAGRLLRYCGVPRASFLARTHKPEVASAFLKDFDGLVTDAWCHLAEIAAPSQETLTLAHLPWDMGGCGFTRHLAIAKQAYAASSEAAFGISNVKQADRVRPVNEGYVEALFFFFFFFLISQTPGSPLSFRDPHTKPMAPVQQVNPRRSVGLSLYRKPWIVVPLGVAN